MLVAPLPVAKLPAGAVEGAVAATAAELHCPGLPADVALAAVPHCVELCSSLTVVRGSDVAP